MTARCPKFSWPVLLGFGLIAVLLGPRPAPAQRSAVDPFAPPSYGTLPLSILDPLGAVNRTSPSRLRYGTANDLDRSLDDPLEATSRAPGRPPTRSRRPGVPEARSSSPTRRDDSGAPLDRSDELFYRAMQERDPARRAALLREDARLHPSEEPDQESPRNRAASTGALRRSSVAADRRAPNARAAAPDLSRRRDATSRQRSEVPESVLRRRQEMDWIMGIGPDPSRTFGPSPR